MKKLVLLVLGCGLWTASMQAQNEKVKISFDGNKVKIENPVKGVTITTKGAHVVINNTVTDKEIDFNLKGSSEDGNITYTGSYKTTFKLKGLNLKTKEGSALDIKCGKRIKLKLDDESDNYLTDGTDTLHNGCIHTKGHLEISGTGKLTITANHGAGIKVKEYMQMKSGTVNINAVGDGSKGIRCAEDVIIDGGDLNIVTTGNFLSDQGQPNFMGGGPGGFGGPDGDFDFGDFKPDSTMMGGFPGGGQGMGGPGGFGGFPGMGGQGGGFPGMPEGMSPDSLRAMFEKMFADFKPDSTMMGGFPGMGGFGGPGMGGEMPDGGMGGFGGPGMGGEMPEGGFGGPDGGMGGPGGRRFYEGTTKAIKALGTVTVNGGNVVLRTSTGGAEGMEGKKGVTINGGVVDIKAKDDAINSNGKIIFNGGKTTAWSMGNDAVDSNYRGEGAITITGGEVYALSQLGPPDEGFDCDFSPMIMTGGTAFSMGGSMGFEVTTPKKGENCPEYLTMQGVSLQEGKELHVNDEAGKSVFSFKIPFTMRQSFGFVTCTDMKKGKTYKIEIK